MHQTKNIEGYSHLSNNLEGWNKRGGGAKVAKSLNDEVVINVEDVIFWKKLVHECNQQMEEDNILPLP